jgi:hypothetical protein
VTCRLRNTYCITLLALITTRFIPLHLFYLVDGVGSKNLQAGNLVHNCDFTALFSGILLLLPLIYLTITGIRGKMRKELPPEEPKGSKPNKKMGRRNEEDCKCAQCMNNECVPTFAVLSLINYTHLVMYQWNGIHFVGSCCHITWSLLYSVIHLENFVYVGCDFVMCVLFYWQILSGSFFIFTRFGLVIPNWCSFLISFQPVHHS